MNLIELTHKNDILQTYEIYKHCMFMPTEEKFNKKVEQFLNNNFVKIWQIATEEITTGRLWVLWLFLLLNRRELRY